MLGGKKTSGLIVIGMLFITLASLMTTQPAYANPVCGSTITGTVKLTANLACGVGDGLVISSSSVTLNCAGHSIMSSSHGYAGISVVGSAGTPLTGLTVENCVVQGWQTGVLLDFVANSIIKKNTATGNFVYGFFLGGTGSSDCHTNTLSDNTASDNSGNSGFNLDNCASNTLKGNKASHNTGDGFNIGETSDSNTIGGSSTTGNTASSNTGDGFRIDFGSGNKLSYNKANSNAAYGYQDLTTGAGTAGTANTYKKDACSLNTLGCSSPAGL